MPLDPRDRAMRALLWVILALILLLAGFMAGGIVVSWSGCAPPRPPPADPADYVDPSGCGAACANLARLGCPGGRGSPGRDEQFGTPDDVGCPEVCRDVIEVGASTTLHQTCTAEADSCAAVERCFERD